MSLLAPLCRITIGKDDAMDTFYSGDGKLLEVTVELGEDDRSSSCSFVISDWQEKIAQKYFDIFFKQGGIIAPQELLQAPQQTGVSSSNVSSGNTPLPTIGSVQDAFKGGSDSLIARAVGHSEGNRDADGGKRQSYFGHGDPGNGQRNVGSFSVQTGTHGNMTPEQADEFWLRQLQAQAPAYQRACQQANINPSDPLLMANFFDLHTQSPRAAQNFLQSFPQLGQQGVNFDNILRARVDSYGGQFSRRAFGDINGLRRDQARRMRALQEVLSKAPSSSAGATAPANPQPAASNPQPPIQDVAASKPAEESQRGTEIIVELGFEAGQLEAFHFIHIASDHNRKASTTTFQGKAVRYVMDRRGRNTSYQNLTLRQLAQRVCSTYRVQLDMEGDGPTYEFLDQTGITDFQLLLRECRAIGYTVQEDRNKLILKPMRPGFTGLVLDERCVIDLTFTDQASADRIIPPPNSVTVYSQPENKASRNTANIDRLTGKVLQNKPEDSTGAGSAPGTTKSQSTGQPTSTTGSPDPPVAGVTTAPGSAPGTAVPGRNNDARSRIPIEQVITTRELAEMRRIGVTEEVIQNLYRIRAERKELQDAADKASGTVPASAAQAEAGRIGRGFESTADLLTQPEILKLKPGQVVAISNTIVTAAFAREWRINKVRHTLSNNGLRTTLSIYSPVALKETTSTGGGGGTSAGAGSSTAPVNLTPGSWTMPVDSNWRGKIGDGVGWRSPTRRHNGVDIAVAGNAIAASDGVVVGARPAGATCPNNGNGCNGNAGNMIVIQHANGYYTRYMHLAPGSFAVREGEQVKGGQKIAVVGTSGGSSGVHLHFEIRRGGEQGQVLVPSDVGIKIERSDVYQPPDLQRFKY